MLMSMDRSRSAATGEQDLVRRLRERDPEALRELVERYQRRLARLVYGIVRDRHEVEDVVQEVFLKVYQRIEAFDERARLYTWLYRVAANAAKDHVKKLSRRPAVALPEEVSIPDGSAGPRAGAAAAERREAVRAAIAALPPHYREVLALRELESMSYTDIAAVLQLSIGTVESRIHRARARLKEGLGHHAP